MNKILKYKPAALSPWHILALLSCIGVSLMSNGFYLLVCLATLYGFFWILWKNNRPGIILFAFLKQWIQVVAYVIWMTTVERDINSLTPHAGIAVVVSCLGLLIMAAIFSRQIRKLPIPTREEFLQEVMKFNEKKIFILYLISTLFLSSLGYAFGGLGGFTQILMTLGSLKWVFFLLFGYVSWMNKKNRFLLILMIVFEFTTGIFSYFSSFKEVFLFTIILSFTLIKKVTVKQVLYGAVFSVALILLLLAWTSIKSDYRQYLNKGTKQQVVNVSRSEAFDKIGDQINELSWANLQLASGMLLYRAQYIYHLSLSMDRVPNVLPYEYGNVWWENISFVLMPRILFPDKPIYQATIKTNKYTGKNYNGLEEGASFSLGYFADSYVDFGYIGMFIPLALLALYVAYIYKVFYGFQTVNIAIRYAIVNVVLYEFTAFEADGLFLFGRLTLMLLVFWVLSKTILPRLQRWLYKK